MAVTPRLGSIKRHFRKLRDPRVVGRSRHVLVDIIVLAICGVIADCDDWPDIAHFARQREGWFRRFLKLPDGVPAHDTFERVFAALDPRAFERCCLAWRRAVADLVGVGQRLALRDIVAALGATTPTWSVRRDMAFLKQLGLVDSSGRGLGARWCLRGVPP